MIEAVELDNITKQFPGVLANDRVTFQVHQGEVHALVGENGAGKSTLMNILYGIHRPDSGEIRIKGQAVTLHSPRDAIAHGLGMVHQHFMLVPSYTVAENIMLGHEPRKYGLVDRAQAEETTRELSRKYHLDVNPKAVIRDLPVGTQQRVEILKALHFGAETIILDEPTAVLTPQESDELFNTIRELVGDGKTIIFITHKLYEVKTISDRVTVLRKGRIVGTVETAQITERELARMMVGDEEIKESIPRPAVKPGDVMLDVHDLVVRDSLGTDAVRGLSLQVREGEIVTLAGVEGNGQTELIEAITGLRPTLSGQICVNGQEVTGKSPDTVRQSGLAHVPEDRITTGINLAATVAENLVARWHRQQPISRRGLMDQRHIKTFASRLINGYDIKTPRFDTLARTLSGGNLQKVVVAREFTFDSPLLVVAQPTRGIDIASSQYIREALIEMRNNGRAVLLVSTDLDEIFSISDRILVMYEGQIAGEFQPNSTTREELGLYMIGAHRQNLMLEKQL